MNRRITLVYQKRDPINRNITGINNYLIFMRKIFLKILVFPFLGILSVFSISCDFESPSEFEMPTWYVDIKLPLIHEKYDLGGMVDSIQIFPTPDSIGMQLVFEDSLPTTSIDPDWLEVEVNQSVHFESVPVMNPELNVSIDTSITINIPLGSALSDTSSPIPVLFSAPPDNPKGIYAHVWNTIVQNTPDFEIELLINLPEIDPNTLPEFVSSIDGIIISDEKVEGFFSYFHPVFTNNGLPTSIENLSYELLTGYNMNDPDTLANGVRDTLKKHVQWNQTHHWLNGAMLSDALKMVYKFGISEYYGDDFDILTIEDTDYVKIDLDITLNIYGVDTAVVNIAKTDLQPELEPIEFPSDIEIYSGLFRSETYHNINEIAISNLKSTFPFDLNFYMNFRNFIPPVGNSDSVKIYQPINDTIPAYSEIFNIST